MAQRPIFVDSRALLARLSGGPSRIAEAVNAGLIRSGQRLERSVKLAVRQRHRIRTGALWNSIRAVVSGDMQKGMLLEVGSQQPDGGKPIVYARMRDLGGTIRPVKARMLAFPIEQFAERFGIVTKAGAGGVRARDVIANPQAFGLLATRLSQSGRAIMGGYREGDKIRWVPIFARRASVEQRGSGYLSATVARAVDGGEVVREIQKAVQRVIP